MEAAAFPKPWRASESKTSTSELLPESTKSYIERTQLWSAWMLQGPSLFTSLIELSQTLSLSYFLEVSTSVFREVESVTGWLIEEQVRLHDARQIRDYIAEFPDLIGVIPQAVQAVKKHLPEAQLILKVYRDPEVEDRYLVLYVRLPRYDEKVLERIEAAETEFIDRLADVKGWLQVTTDFGEPESRIGNAF
ncbi:MAG: hypothetical protein D6687_09465 [Acidobacteria bacterium]|nr:MAG: hypothetical protein D6687_09465 [Acidobacteriota bacterium]